jgi:hypothetical protein
MKNAVRLLACLLILATGASRATAADPPAKPAETRTALTSAQSPPLSAEQLAKQARLGELAPVPAPARTGKVPPLSTSLPAAPGGPRVLTPAEKQGDPLTALRQRDLATALGRPVAAHAPAPAKPQPLVTSRPLDPARASAVAAAQARKRVQAQARSTTGVAVPGSKPAARETRETAPALLSPAQLAKQAQAKSTAGGGR